MSEVASSTNLLLIVLGVALFLVVLAKLRSHQTGGFNLGNFGL
jgi:hypothetical protein